MPLATCPISFIDCPLVVCIISTNSQSRRSIVELKSHVRGNSLRLPVVVQIFGIESDVIRQGRNDAELRQVLLVEKVLAKGDVRRAASPAVLRLQKGDRTVQPDRRVRVRHDAPPLADALHAVIDLSNWGSPLDGPRLRPVLGPVVVVQHQFVRLVPAERQPFLPLRPGLVPPDANARIERVEQLHHGDPVQGDVLRAVGTRVGEHVPVHVLPKLLYEIRAEGRVVLHHDAPSRRRFFAEAQGTDVIQSLVGEVRLL
mmetsp:Transcript_47414/g.88041  ORF Transcript_47414/g.88041 Transcript_47414/m.88041 type:complete len:257 (+) Transcript_47414:634-1404(+)